MGVLNLNNADKLYYGATEVQKLYKGSELLYSKSTDPYWDNVVLYLKGDGANNSTNIVDSSPSPKTISVFSTAVISTNQSKYGNSSLLFQNIGDYLSTDITPFRQLWENVDTNVTIEGWVYPFSFGTHRNILDTRQTSNLGGELRFNATTAQINFYNTSGTNYSVGNPAFTVNEWQHFAMTRSSRVVRLFRNGVIAGTPTTFNTNRSINVSNLHINNSTNTFLGHLDSLRITLGVARYIANFNPETDTYLAY